MTETRSMPSVGNVAFTDNGLGPFCVILAALSSDILREKQAMDFELIIISVFSYIQQRQHRIN